MTLSRLQNRKQLLAAFIFLTFSYAEVALATSPPAPPTLPKLSKRQERKPEIREPRKSRPAIAASVPKLPDPRGVKKTGAKTLAPVREYPDMPPLQKIEEAKAPEPLPVKDDFLGSFNQRVGDTRPSANPPAPVAEGEVSQMTQGAPMRETTQKSSAASSGGNANGTQMTTGARAAY
jgi:hypothetical protein